MGLVLSVFFGIGIVLLTIINRSAGGNQAGLNEFIFGQAAAWYAVMCIYLQALPSYYLPLLFFCLKN
nr:metal ABC transporter permease [Geomicrobium sp. JCM 19037]